MQRWQTSTADSPVVSLVPCTGHTENTNRRELSGINPIRVYIQQKARKGSTQGHKFSSVECLTRYWYIKGRKCILINVFSAFLLVPGASGNPCNDAYRGTHAFSEVEVKNVANYLKDNQIAGYMDIHAYSQLWMIPWGYTQQPTNDHEELVRKLPVKHAIINPIVISKALHHQFEDSTLKPDHFVGLFQCLVEHKALLHRLAKLNFTSLFCYFFSRLLLH